jgi:hypothetical protein
MARLWNVTSNAMLSNSTRILNQILELDTGDRFAGQNTTAPIGERITVSAPTTLELQAARINATGKTGAADVRSENTGYTSFRFQEISP